MKRRKLFALIVLIVFGQVSGAGRETALSRFKEIEKSVDTRAALWQQAGYQKDWQEYKLGDTIKDENFFLAAAIQVPGHVAGAKVAGTPLKIRLVMAARGRFEVSASRREGLMQSFAIDGGDGNERELVQEMTLTEALSPGRYKVLLDVKGKGFSPARSEYWPPRRKPLAEEGTYFVLRRADLIYPEAEANLKMVRNWVNSLRTAFGLLNPELVRYTFIGKPFAIPDRRRVSSRELARLQKSWDQTVLAFDLAAMATGSQEQVEAALQKSKILAAGLRDYVKQFKAYLIGNAHIDIAWLWRMAETELVARNTFDTVINNMEEYPEFCYAQSQALTYEWMERKYPQIFQRIVEKIRQGRWEVVGGMWVEPDCNLPAGESFVRQILFGKNYFKNKFGLDVRIAWNPDSFGYNWNLPQILKKSGFDFFITQKIRWNDTTIFPHYIFWWQGADDTKLLTYFPPWSYTAELELDDVVNEMGKYEATTGYRKSLILYGLGDHGGGPNREILDRVRDHNQLFIAPEFIHAPAGRFLGNIVKDLGQNIPVWNDELYLEYHRGTYTTQSEVKRGNRQCEALLAAAEKTSTIAGLLGYEYPAEELNGWWKVILTNQFHDILPGSSITPVYRDALEAYSGARLGLKQIIRRGLSAIAEQIDSAATAGIPLLVFNPLSWPRSDLVRMPLPDEAAGGSRLVDSRGEEVALEILRPPEADRTELIFVAERIPALGYRVYWLQPGKQSEKPSVLAGDGRMLENEFYRLTVNPDSGNITGLFDKKNSKEFIPAGQQANVLQIHEDRPERWDAWDIGTTGRFWELDKADRVELAVLSPVRAVLRIKKSFLGLAKERYSPTETFPSSFFDQTITLYRHLDRIDIRTEADWWEDHMLLKAKFPVTLQSNQAAYEIPFAAIYRTTGFTTLWEKARYEVPALRWADLSDQRHGLSILNDGKYGYDIHGNVMRISLLRAPTWPDPTADRGKHQFTYSLYAHQGGWPQEETVHRGQELNNPLLPVILDRHPGRLPPEFSFFQVESDGVILDSLKMAEDGSGWILRLYESKGRSQPARLRLFKKPARVWETDLLEKPIAEMRPLDKTINLRFKKFEIRTLKISFI